MPPRSFRPIRASLAGSGPLLVMEDTSDLPVRPRVVYSYVDVPADWQGSGLERHIEKMQEAAIADLAKQGWSYDGGPFVYKNPFTGMQRYIPHGFAMQRTGMVTHATGEGEVAHIEYASNNVPVRNGVVRYILAARYLKRDWKTELIIPEEQARGGSVR